MAKVFEKRINDSRCYRTTTYYLFGKRVRRTQEYKGGKAPRAPKAPTGSVVAS